MPRRQQGMGVSSVGYPRGPRSNVGIEDWQQKLEQMRREAREMKGVEAQLRWQMKRDEDKTRKNETREDASKIMQWRQEQKQGLQEYAADRALGDKITTLKESKDFQEFKRAVKQEDKEEEIQEAKELYNETKDNSEWTVEQKRTIPLEEQKLIVDQNLERYTLLSMYNIEESQREKYDARVAREELEETTLGYAMLEARKERDAALQSLEYFRQHQRESMPANKHIQSRPFYPNNQPI